jgi:hypothetical protein
MKLISVTSEGGNEGDFLFNYGDNFFLVEDDQVDKFKEKFNEWVSRLNYRCPWIYEPTAENPALEKDGHLLSMHFYISEISDVTIGMPNFPKGEAIA